jgi:hypothetical protein
MDLASNPDFWWLQICWWAGVWLTMRSIADFGRFGVLRAILKRAIVFFI